MMVKPTWALAMPRTVPAPRRWVVDAVVHARHADNGRRGVERDGQGRIKMPQKRGHHEGAGCVTGRKAELVGELIRFRIWGITSEGLSRRVRDLTNL